MSKLIQREMKRSLPMVMIALLLNLSVYGLVFNLTFGFSDALIKGLPSAHADTASSTVTVKNAPPLFVGNAAEVVVSSSTSPVNVGNSIAFIATSSDAGLEDYYLLVCKTNNATTTVGAAPHCVDAGAQLCVSATSTTGNSASCTHTGVIDPGGETQSWYAFACDAHGTQPLCSVATEQGSGDSGSPFYVNRQPYFNSAATISDNKDPGALFTFGATTTDRDVAGSNDIVTLSVCKTNSYSTTTGCAVPWCSATTTTNGATPVGLSCQGSTTIPWAHGASSTFAFIKDSHELQATSTISFNFITNDVSPIVSNNIDFNGGAPIFLNLKGAASTTVWATSTSVTDNNGCNDINSATSTMFWATSTNSATCSPDNNKCYQIPSSSCTISSCSAGSVIATVACSAQLAFYAVPTVASGTNPHASTNWQVAISAKDDTNSSSTVGTTGIEMGVSLGLDVAELSIAYGTLVAGANTGSFNSTTTIVSLGNAPLSNDITGTWMSKGVNHIAENQQQFSMNNFGYGAGTALSSTTPYTLDLNIPRPITTATTSAPVYWGMALPAGIPSGDYSGVNTFIGILASTSAPALWN